jgi:hypothetical protein
MPQRMTTLFASARNPSPQPCFPSSATAAPDDYASRGIWGANETITDQLRVVNRVHQP